MKILGMGMPELLIILAVILLIFGPKNLPKLGASVGKTVKSLREGLGGGEKLVEAETRKRRLRKSWRKLLPLPPPRRPSRWPRRPTRSHKPTYPSLTEREPSLPRAQQPPAASVPWAVAHLRRAGGRREATRHLRYEWSCKA